jgi:hypothetical protein
LAFCHRGWNVPAETIYDDFDIQGRRIRVVITPEEGVYVLFRVGDRVAVRKGTHAGGGGYTIDGKGRCSCPGYRHRQKCKHVGWYEGLQ